MNNYSECLLCKESSLNTELKFCKNCAVCFGCIKCIDSKGNPKQILFPNYKRNRSINYRFFCDKCRDEYYESQKQKRALGMKDCFITKPFRSKYKYRYKYCNLCRLELKIYRRSLWEKGLVPKRPKNNEQCYHIKQYTVPKCSEINKQCSNTINYIIPNPPVEQYTTSNKKTCLTKNNIHEKN